MTAAATTREVVVGPLVALGRPVVGAGTHDVRIPFTEPGGQQILGTPRQLALAVRDALTTRLGHTTRVVGPRDAAIGTAFAGGSFNTHLNAHVDIDSRKGRLAYSDALVEACSHGLADAVRVYQLQYLGTMGVPGGVPPGDAVQVDNPTVALRLTTHYDIRRDANVVWIDLLGAP